MIAYPHGAILALKLSRPFSLVGINIMITRLFAFSLLTCAMLGCTYHPPIVYESNYMLSPRLTSRTYIEFRYNDGVNTDKGTLSQTITTDLKDNIFQNIVLNKNESDIVVVVTVKKIYYCMSPHGFLWLPLCLVGVPVGTKTAQSELQLEIFYRSSGELIREYKGSEHMYKSYHGIFYPQNSVNVTNSTFIAMRKIKENIAKDLDLIQAKLSGTGKMPVIAPPAEITVEQKSKFIEKLEELDNAYKKKLITEEEYVKKRKELIEKQ
jgi:hypothetical protein